MKFFWFKSFSLIRKNLKFSLKFDEPQNLWNSFIREKKSFWLSANFSSFKAFYKYLCHIYKYLYPFTLSLNYFFIGCELKLNWLLYFIIILYGERINGSSENVVCVYYLFVLLNILLVGLYKDFCDNYKLCNMIAIIWLL